MLLVPIVVALVLLRGSWRWLRHRPSIKARWPLSVRSEPDGWQAVRGILPGAAVGALIFPMGPFLLALAWAITRDHPSIGAVGTLALDAIRFVLVALALFLTAGFFWCFAIAMSLQVWSLFCWRGVPGPWIAAALGAGLAMLTASVTLHFDMTAPILPIVGLLMGVAGGASGATVWWAAYRPGVLSARMRLCPILTRGACMAQMG